jgi:NADH-quinone oxidoreductase subunit M
MNAFPWITILTLVPFCGGVLLLCLPAERKGSARLLGLTMAFASLALALVIWTIFQKTTGTLQLQELHDWIPTLGVRYHVGLDGLSLLMVLLSTIVVPMALLASWNIQERVPAYFGLVLLLEAGLIGTFTALNFFHWFLFWELSLIPAFFLIKFWGGPLRSAAATQFFVYTMVGSVGLLLAFLAIFLTTNKFDFVELSELGRNGSLISALSNLGWRDLTARSLGVVIFALAFLGLAVKVPLVPFHTWLPTAYAEAPTGTTMLLTGLMSKMGVYGFVRILVPIFPEAMRLVITPLLWLAAISIVFSAGAAFAQRDLKRMLAYSSINHLGYCLL